MSAAMLAELTELDETTDPSITSARDEAIHACHGGLGPDDLVSVERSGGSSRTLSHHFVVGLILDSVTVFLDYYSRIGELQLEQNSRLCGSGRQQLIRAILRSYNSFTGRDYSIEVSASGVNSNISDNVEFWRQLKFSCVLRYYRCHLPLFGSLFGGCISMSFSTNLIAIEGGLTREDVDFIAMNHEISNDFLDAFVRLILLSLEISDFVNFLEMFEHKFPSFFCRIAEFLPARPDILDAVYFYAEHHWKFFPDDLSSALLITNYYVNQGTPEKCKPFVPLLMSSVWDDPRCGITLARLVSAEGRHGSAFLFLNESGFAAWPMIPDFVGLSGSEKRLLKTPFVGAYSELFDAIREIYEGIGREQFELLYEKFIEGRSVQDFAATAAPASLCIDGLACDSPDEFFLFDPGIQEDASVSEEKAFAPLSSIFQEAIRGVVNFVATHAKLVGKRLALTNDPTRNLTVAVRMKDGGLARSVFASMIRGRTAGFVDYGLMYRAAMMGIVDVNDVASAPVPQGLNQGQRNALLFMKHFVPPLVRKYGR
jgi:hypothetical protein